MDKTYWTYSTINVNHEHDISQKIQQSFLFFYWNDIILLNLPLWNIKRKLILLLRVVRGLFLNCFSKELSSKKKFSWFSFCKSLTLQFTFIFKSEVNWSLSWAQKQGQTVHSYWDRQSEKCKKNLRQNTIIY